MRVFVIRDDELGQKDLGYLVYYERSKAFYIELPETADEWETPLILSSFVRRGEHSVNAYWSKQWVLQRIIPQDRQNLGQILRDNHLNEYDELSLLLLGHGRCAQDNVYIEEIDHLPDKIQSRWRYKIEDVIPLTGYELLVFFRDGSARKMAINDLVGNEYAFVPYLTKAELFNTVSLQPDGYGIQWSDNAVLPDWLLYHSGEKIPLRLDDFYRFVSMRVVNASEAQQLLHCTRQNIADLVKRGKLHPVRTDGNNRLFRLVEIQQRMNIE